MSEITYHLWLLAVCIVIGVVYSLFLEQPYSGFASLCTGGVIGYNSPRIIRWLHSKGL